ncbi:MAG: hypothetical protein JNK73_12765 [Bacteroidia bacterium]|nr:hypothetical protein [Bacteroidia bacterium]
MQKPFHILLFLLLPCFVFAQKIKFKGAGIYGAGLSSAHYYKNDLSTPTIVDSNGTKWYYPQSHISKEFINWGAGAFVEFSLFRKLRWQTELEYANKGAQEMEIVDRKEQRSGSYSPNKYTYIQWNNYVKSYTKLIFGSSYWMAGARVEYLFRKSTPVFAPYSANLKTFWFSADLGVGWEIRLTERFYLFTEGHWNPDVISQKQDFLKIRNRTFEVRLGITYRPRKQKVDDCNAPVYKGPAY